MSESRTRVDVQGVIAGLERLVLAQEPIARAMGFAMAVEVRDEAQIRAPLGTAEGGSITPGLLKSAIYAAYDQRFSILSPGVYRYNVSWNSKKAPHGHLVEFGHWMPYMYGRTTDGDYFTYKTVENPTKTPGEGGFWVRQYAFLGPAFDAKLPRLSSVAIAAGTKRFSELMQ